VNINAGIDWRVLGKSSRNVKSVEPVNSRASGIMAHWMFSGENTTIVDSLRITNASGSVLEYISKTLPVDIIDPLDLEISRMTTEEVIDEIKLLAGTWADRDDLDYILDRRDRIDEIYAPYITDESDKTV